LESGWVSRHQPNTGAAVPAAAGVGMNVSPAAQQGGGERLVCLQAQRRSSRVPPASRNSRHDLFVGESEPQGTRLAAGPRRRVWHPSWSPWRPCEFVLVAPPRRAGVATGGEPGGPRFGFAQAGRAPLRFTADPPTLWLLKTRSHVTRPDHQLLPLSNVRPQVSDPPRSPLL